jgi:cobalt-zinc-cadmium efflux system protein
MGDVGASIAVIVGALIIQFTGWLMADPILSILISALVIFEAWKIIVETVNVLMEGTPPHIDISQLVAEVKAIPGVKELHDLHVWNLSSKVDALSCHLVLDDRALSECRNVVETVEELLTHKFRVGHTTLQLETESCGHALYCTIIQKGASHENVDPGRLDLPHHRGVGTGPG